jgi:hypothetical protein
MIGSIPMQGSQDFSATFTQAVGALTVKARVSGKICTLEIPAGSTADGGGGTIAAPAATIPSHMRPSADISVPVIVSDNGVKVLGRLIIDSDGSLVFSVGAAGASFTDDAAAGFDRCSATYILP